MSDAPFAYYPRLRRVESYVYDHPRGRLSLAELAAVAGLEETYFSKYFRLRTGTRVHDWVNTVRLERAKEIMKREDIAITQVAHEAGFSTLRTFERVFSRMTGMSPRTYKENLHSELKNKKVTQSHQELSPPRRNVSCAGP